MKKLKVDLTKSLYEQPWWDQIKPDIKLKMINIWKQTDRQVEELISSGKIVINNTTKGVH